LHCGGELERSHPVWSKTIIVLGEIARVTNWGYRCVNRDKYLFSVQISELSSGVAPEKTASLLLPKAVIFVYAIV
jgi:hypothetical protein